MNASKPTQEIAIRLGDGYSTIAYWVNIIIVK